MSFEVAKVALRQLGSDGIGGNHGTVRSKHNGYKVSEVGTVAEPQAIEKALNELNKWFGDVSVRLSFIMHEGTGQMMVRLVDQRTGEVLKEIPPSTILDTAARIKEFIGLFLDKRL